MAFIKGLGAIPIIASFYNRSLHSRNDVVQRNIISLWEWGNTVNMDDYNSILAGALGLPRYASLGQTLVQIPIESTSITHPNTNLTLYASDGQSGIYSYRIGMQANSALNFGGNDRVLTIGERACIVACAVYGDALGADLLGYEWHVFGETGDGKAVHKPAGDNQCAFINIKALDDLGYTITVVSHDDNYGDESTESGYGQSGTTPAFDHSSDVIGLPTMPAVSTSSVGFIHLYSVTQATLTNLSDYLFPDIMQDLADIMQQLPVALADLPNVLVPILRAFASIFAYRDSVQYIIDLHAIPAPPTIGGNDYIKIGALSTDISAGVISSDYIDVDCGSLSIAENFQNFLDYMTSCKIFLPFIGFVDIKPELWNGGTIGVKYRFNVVDGSFMCFLFSTSGKSKLSNTIIGQYGGSACIHLPMVAAEYGAIIGGIVQGAMAVDKVSGAGSASQMASAEAGLASALMNFNANPPMQQSNGYNASASFMGGRTPYLMIEYPVPQFSKTYTHEKGLPLNVNMSFSSLRGYTEIDPNVDLSGINAPVDIIDEIRSALSSGTIF